MMIVYPEAFRHCADHRDVLYSTPTSHDPNVLYSSVEQSLPPWFLKIVKDEVAANQSVTCDSVNELIDLLHHLLLFHAFCKYGQELHKHTGRSNLKCRTVLMLYKIKSIICRGAGTRGWRTSKFHDLIHLTLDAFLFGHPSNFEVSSNETGLKYWAKLPGRTCQASMGADKFLRQLGNRLCEQTLLEKSNSLLVGRKKAVKDRQKDELRCPLFVVNRENRTWCECHADLSRKKIPLSQLDQDLLLWLCRARQLERKEIVIYSELHLTTSDAESFSFRAHSNYKLTGRWHDFPRVQHENARGDSHVDYPCRLYGFMYADDGERKLAFGQSCATQSQSELKLSENGLFQHWHLETKLNNGIKERVFRFMEVETIISGGFAVPVPNSALAPVTANSSDKDEYSDKIIFVTDRHDRWPWLFIEDGLYKIQNKKVARRRRDKRKRGN